MEVKIMFIIFDKTTKQILSYGQGTPMEMGNLLVLGSETICNDLSVCWWKYIADQRLETDENGSYLHDADYYEEIDTPVTIEELKEQLAATNAILLDMYLGV